MIQMGERIVLDRVYLTALTNERYLPGVMAMARSLHTVETKYPLAVMIPEEKEEALGRAVREYGILDVPGTFLLPKKFEISEIQSFTPPILDYKFDYWRETFFKLRAAGCTEFDKLILLDCDQMVVKNIDHLFDALPLTATICGKCVHDDWKGLSAGLLVIEPSSAMYEKLLCRQLNSRRPKVSKPEIKMCFI